MVAENSLSLTFVPPLSLSLTVPCIEEKKKTRDIKWAGYQVGQLGRASVRHGFVQHSLQSSPALYFGLCFRLSCCARHWHGSV